MKTFIAFGWVLVMALLGGGCASYATPGAAADMRSLGATAVQQRTSGDKTISEYFDRKALAAFPAAVAAVRVQAGDYRSRTYPCTNTGGRYTVITIREV